MTDHPTPPGDRNHRAAKVLGESVVLDGIAMRVAAGTVFALLGANGAGKTTTVEIITTLLGADAGTVHVAGHDVAEEPDAVRAAIGVTGQLSAVDGLLTGRENLRLMADLHHLTRSEGRRRLRRHADRLPAAVRLRLRRHARRGLGPGSGGRGWSRRLFDRESAG